MRLPLNPLHFLAQVVPPLIWFWFLYGTWNPGSALLAGPPTLYCLLVLPWRLFKRQHGRVLRPLLVVLLGAVFIGMGNYYERSSREYVDALAAQMQAQCDRDGHCAPPPGPWKRDGENRYRMRSPGAVPFPISLTLSGIQPPYRDCTPTPPACTRRADPQPAAAAQAAAPPNAAPAAQTRYISFMLIRYLTDFSHMASGGVGLRLKTEMDKG